MQCILTASARSVDSHTPGHRNRLPTPHLHSHGYSYISVSSLSVSNSLCQRGLTGSLIPPHVHLVVSGNDSTASPRTVDLHTPDPSVGHLPRAVPDALLGTLLKDLLDILPGDGGEDTKVDTLALLILQRKGASSQFHYINAFMGTRLDHLLLHVPGNKHTSFELRTSVVIHIAHVLKLILTSQKDSLPQIGLDRNS